MCLYNTGNPGQDIVEDMQKKKHEANNQGTEANVLISNLQSILYMNMLKSIQY